MRLVPPTYRRPLAVAVAVLSAGLLALTACRRTAGDAAAAAGAPLPPTSDLPVATSFDDYWYPHGAELSRYALSQSRYGHQAPGDAVLIFVTEPFDTVQQVKSDDPRAVNAVPILKLNMSKTFTTGVYPYSMLESVFSPRDLAKYPEPLKVTVSSQEWCGHTFTQLNRTANGGYDIKQFSYFQSEGDTETALAPNANEGHGVYTESGIWTRIRLDPASLPTGKLQMLPDPMYLRLTHGELVPQAATGTVAEEATRRGMNDEALRRYTLEYPGLQRSLTIWYHAAFPHIIEGWEDRYPAAVGKPDMLTTTATRTHSMMLDYWAHHNPEDRELRRRLGLPVE